MHAPQERRFATAVREEAGGYKPPLPGYFSKNSRMNCTVL